MAVIWITHLQEALKKSPVLTNISLFFILVALEKLAEMQFQCPCQSDQNGLFVAYFFAIPAVIALSLMLSIQFPGKLCKPTLAPTAAQRTDTEAQTADTAAQTSLQTAARIAGCTAGCIAACIAGCEVTIGVLTSLVPSIVWMILLFLDGRYFACGMTHKDCNGSYKSIIDGAGHRYCELFIGNITKVDCEKDTTTQIIESQWKGLYLLILLCVGVILYAIYVICTPNKDVKDKTKDMKDMKEPPGNTMQMRNIAPPPDVRSPDNSTGDDEIEPCLPPHISSAQ